MSYNCEHGVIGGDEYSCQECAKRDSAALATASADCAAMREALEKERKWHEMKWEAHLEAARETNEYDKDLSNAEMVCADIHAARMNELSAALTGRPTGQSILDELSAARKLLDRARQLAVQSCAIEGDEWGTLAANIDAARKANTGAKQ